MTVLTEHEALRLAIAALNEIPNRTLKGGKYANTYTLLPVLTQAYVVQAGEKHEGEEQQREEIEQLVTFLKKGVFLNGRAAIVTKHEPNTYGEVEVVLETERAECILSFPLVKDTSQEGER